MLVQTGTQIQIYHQEGNVKHVGSWNNLLGRAVGVGWPYICPTNEARSDKIAHVSIFKD